mmetsp:Transcript_145883/g.406332  ORF Transcript_145883/g.406332 Transcript_145883/m.406332 type:complete len:269 (+) Transcript_145883:344-1150(+)
MSIILLKSVSNRSDTACSPSVSILRFCRARSNSSAIGNNSLITGMAALPRAAESSCRVRARKFSTSSFRRSCAFFLSSAWAFSSSISARSFSHACAAASESSSSASASAGASSLWASPFSPFLFFPPPPKKRQTWRDLLGVGAHLAAARGPAALTATRQTAGRKQSHETATVPSATAAGERREVRPWTPALGICPADRGRPTRPPRKAAASGANATTAQEASNTPPAARRRRERGAAHVLRVSMLMSLQNGPRPSRPRCGPNMAVGAK